MFPHISTKAMEIEKGEKPKGGVNKWLNGLPVMYRWLRLKTLGSHLRNQEECASVLSHQWKRKKTRKTLGFGETLEVPGVLVVQEEALRQSRKNQDLVGKAVYVPDISSTATGGDESGLRGYGTEYNSSTVYIIPSNSHKHLFEYYLDIPPFPMYSKCINYMCLIRSGGKIRKTAFQVTGLRNSSDLDTGKE